MASRRKGTQLGGANRQQRSVGNVSGLASCQVWEAGSGKAWAWEAQDDMEAADREGLQRVEALGYQPS